MTILDEFVTDVKASIAAARTKGETILAWFGAEAVTLTDEAYDDLKTFFTAVAPGTLANFNATFSGVLADAGTLAFDYLTGKSDEAVIADILNKAEALGIAELKTLSTPALKLMLNLKAQAAQAVSDAAGEVKSVV